MKTILAVELFGREVPSAGVGGILIAGMVIFFLFSRASAGAGGTGGRKGDFAGGAPRMEGHGRRHQCTRCGRDFYAEQTEYLPNGQERHVVNDRCPNCGWDLDWGNFDDPNNPMRR